LGVGRGHKKPRSLKKKGMSTGEVEVGEIEVDETIELERRKVPDFPY